MHPVQIAQICTYIFQKWGNTVIFQKWGNTPDSQNCGGIKPHPQTFPFRQAPTVPLFRSFRGRWLWVTKDDPFPSVHPAYPVAPPMVCVTSYRSFYASSACGCVLCTRGREPPSSFVSLGEESRSGAFDSPPNAVRSQA